jgi:diguanylate cyclase (GGDEF)-like protein
MVVGVCSPGPPFSAYRLAEDLGIPTISDIAKVFDIPAVDVIIDASEDPGVYPRLKLDLPAGVSLIGGAGCEIFLESLIAQSRYAEQTKLFEELKTAYDEISRQEHRLNSSRKALEQTNAHLECRLAEIFFTHEFFKALTRFTTVDDVASLIVDGCNGILGAEISCVYLCNREDWTLRLRACQGRPSRAFHPSVLVSETVLGAAFSDGPVNEPDVSGDESSTAWVTDPGSIASQAAVPLRAGEEVLGVIVMASSTPRELSEIEMERLEVLGSQASLSLHNALLHEELERLSVTDRLTELYNHGFFQLRLEEEFQRSKRYGHPLSLIMIDIDDFKEFNDTHGHPRGDRVLKEVSEVIRSALRDVDVAARYGGEEFVVVLPETPCEGARQVAERIRAGVERVSHAVGDRTAVGMTVSVGVATFTGDAETSGELLEMADAAMYSGKRAGKNRVVAVEC